MAKKKSLEQDLKVLGNIDKNLTKVRANLKKFLAQANLASWIPYVNIPQGGKKPRRTTKR
ncbi:MAG TPA: hypothetical protein VN325_35615 [Steroidobacteraceae bacterium]|jgi:hypothetical protein|nr:hypothetical protein [Steroidobacteraceae bacterium]